MRSKNCRNFYWNAIVRIFWLCLIDPDCYLIHQLLSHFICLMGVCVWDRFVYAWARLVIKNVSQLENKNLSARDFLLLSLREPFSNGKISGVWFDEFSIDSLQKKWCIFAFLVFTLQNSDATKKMVDIWLPIRSEKKMCKPRYAFTWSR